MFFPVLNRICETSADDCGAGLKDEAEYEATLDGEDVDVRCVESEPFGDADQEVVAVVTSRPRVSGGNSASDARRALATPVTSVQRVPLRR